MKFYIPTNVVPTFHSPNDKSRLYKAISVSTPNGKTRDELAKSLRIDTTYVAFYLSELRRDGYICVVGDPSSNVAPTMNAQEAAYSALLGLENALIAKVRTSGITDEIDKAFKTYQGCKARALDQEGKPEGQTALRMALKRLIDLVL